MCGGGNAGGAGGVTRWKMGRRGALYMLSACQIVDTSTAKCNPHQKMGECDQHKTLWCSGWRFCWTPTLVRLINPRANPCRHLHPPSVAVPRSAESFGYQTSLMSDVCVCVCACVFTHTYKHLTPPTRLYIASTCDHQHDWPAFPNSAHPNSQQTRPCRVPARKGR